MTFISWSQYNALTLNVQKCIYSNVKMFTKISWLKMMVNEKISYSKIMWWIVGYDAYGAFLVFVIAIDIFPWLLFGLLNKNFKKYNVKQIKIIIICPQ